MVIVKLSLGGGGCSAMIRSTFSLIFFLKGNNRSFLQLLRDYFCHPKVESSLAVGYTNVC